MTWPPDERWPFITSLWSMWRDPSASPTERTNAFLALKEIQGKHDLSDTQVAFICESQILDPSTRTIRRERHENAFEAVLNAVDEVGVVMPFEHCIVDAVFIPSP